jgi:inosose dehydratase
MTAKQMTRPEDKIAGAPISWGVCEVPGWGYQLSPDRVLKEMREVGLVATELGPEGFLPSEPAAMARVLSEHGLQAVGGFTPLLLHLAGHDPLPEVDHILDGYRLRGTGSGLVGRHRLHRLSHAAATRSGGVATTALQP